MANSKIKYRLPIWVPAQSFTSNPQVEANEAINVHGALGFNKVIALDAEENSGFTLTWGEVFGATLKAARLDFVLYHGGDKPVPSSASSWLAFWTGNPPNTLPDKSAQQYRGATSFCNMSVDLSIAALDFPLEGLNIPQSEIGEDMEIIACTTAGHADLLVVGSKVAAVPNQDALSVLIIQGVPVRHLDEATYDWVAHQVLGV